MGRTSELWYENQLKGFETFVKGEIKGVITYNLMSGVYDRKNWMFQDYDVFEDIVDGLYLECFSEIRETIRDVVECNFDCLKKVS